MRPSRTPPQWLSVFAAALFLFHSVGCRNEPDHSNRPPVIVISIDTLRADHLPQYGYRGVATPNIDALARDGVVFDRAYSHCPLTLPSHVSIFTGLRPSENGVHDNIGYTLDARRHPTIATLLKAEGYDTAAVISAYVLRRSTGIAAGFDSYDDDIPFVDGAPAASLQRSGSESVRLARHWLESRGNNSFFFFLHLYEPHAPYTPPPPFDRVALPYDGEIAAADAFIGEFLSALRKRNLYDNAIIVLLSDHGEGLMDHGEQEHGILLYREAIHVPLIIKLPRNELHDTRDRDEVQLTDVLPTLLDLLSIHKPPVSGRSLLDSMRGKAPLPACVLRAETLYPQIHLGWSGLQSAIKRGMQFIDSPHSELFDLTRDPREKANVLDQQRRVALDLRKAIEDDATAFAQPAPIDREEAAKLAALGYVSAAPASFPASRIDPKEHLGELADLKEATEAMNRRDAGRAVPLLQRLLERNPGWSDVRDQLAEAEERRGHAEGAMRLYQDGMRLNPSLAGDFALSIGELLLRQHRYAQAEAHAQLAMRSNAPAAHQLLGAIALAQSDLATAEREAKVAASFPTQALEAGVLWARIESAQGKLDAAITRLEQIRQTATARHLPLPADFDFLLGDTLARAGRVPQAEASFRRAIQVQPDNLAAYTSLALLQMMLDHQDDAALNTLELMCANNPGDSARSVAIDDLEKWGHAGVAERFREHNGS